MKHAHTWEFVIQEYSKTFCEFNSIALVVKRCKKKNLLVLTFQRLEQSHHSPRLAPGGSSA